VTPGKQSLMGFLIVVPAALRFQKLVAGAT